VKPYDVKIFSGAKFHGSVLRVWVTGDFNGYSGTDLLWIGYFKTKKI
jgi:hypothetical protein